MNDRMRNTALRIRAAVLSASVSRRAGGMFTSVRRTAQELAHLGVDVHVLGLKDHDTSEDLPAWNPLRPEVFDTLPPRAFGFAPKLSHSLWSLSPDVVHVQGLWMSPSMASAWWARKTSRPHLISPRGMLDPWALRNSRWKKRLVGMAFENRHLSAANCLHALCESEYRSIRDYGLNNPVCVIPNGVDLEDTVVAQLPERLAAIFNGRRVLLFVGRIHPKKGLAELISAWSAVPASNRQDWRLVIAGWDQGGHSQELQRQIDGLGISTEVQLVGPLFGTEKLAALRSSHAFVLPSKSEGLPMAVLEAWAQRLPVAMTDECNLPEGFQLEAAVKLASDPRQLAASLTGFLELTDEQRRKMGNRGRKLVEDRFQWQGIAAKLERVYRWILGEGSTPDSVILD